MRLLLKTLLVSAIIAPMLMTNQATGQTTLKKFSRDSTLFLQEVDNMLSASRKKEAKEFIEEFTPVWFGGNFSEDERREVYRICDFMLSKRMQPFPDFKSYLFALMSFAKSGQPKESFVAWQSSLESLIGGKSRKKFTSYLEFCNNLFANNDIYKSAVTVWHSSNNNYSFELENKKPKIIFPEMTLTCYAKRDSSVIVNTSGVYYPLELKWIGKGGSVTWERAGFEAEKVYAVLNNYKIQTRKSSFEADSVLFTNKKYFSEPLMGHLSERVLANVVAEKASFPKFNSYSKRLRIANIVPSIDYDGGFAQHGPKFIGLGTDEEPAKMIVNRHNKPFLVAATKQFTIRPDRIVSSRAAITIYLDKDSVIHPGLTFRFKTEDRLLTLIRNNEGVQKSPYYDTYHDVDMYFEALYWKIDDPVIKMGPITGSTDKTANFESSNYYRENRFDRLQGLSMEHPLVLIKDCAVKYDTNRISAKDVAGCMRISASQARPMLMKLSNLGFLIYDYGSDEVVLKERLYNYILAKSEQQDYDVIQFGSELTRRDRSEYNASLNLLNFNMSLSGVKRIYLSDSHNVFIRPLGREITLKENRDFTFSGIINAGRFEFFGREYSFTYDDFKIDMPNIDSLRMRVEVGQADQYGKRKNRRVKTVIEAMSGELLVDKPGNKSGLQSLSEYPIFKSLKDSYVYYERSSIQNGTYKRENFFFHLEPFVFDSLDRFRSEGIRFKGTFQSAGIFPDFEEELVLMPDFSLGFNTKAPKSGYPVYGGKAIFKNNIAMSHEGLRGDGVLKYLTSTTKSDDFILFPDSTNALAQSFNIQEQMGDPQFPPVNGKDIYLHWEPYQDNMELNNTKDPFTFYDGNSTLDGRLALQPSGLTGGGLFAFEEAEMESELYRFQFSEFFADTADFRLKSKNDELDLLSFKTNNVNAHIDFAKRKGTFVSNGGGSYVDFPINQYIAYMDRFTWYMDDDQIELSAGKTKDKGANALAFEGSRFISTHPKQDSLDFYSVAARYNLATHIITAKQVEFIAVADAMVYPDSGTVVIKKKAEMQTLEDCEVVANSVTKYHKIYGGNVNIYGKRDYSGSGYYDYIDENKRKQTIHLTTLTVDSSAQTYGTGTIVEDESFTLSPYFEYKGDVRLEATSKFLRFTGSTKIQHECFMLDRPWVNFSAEIDPEEIYIPIDSNLQDEGGKRLGASVMLNKDSISLYSSFLSPVTGRNDLQVMPADGFLIYDKESSEYKISNLNKLNTPALPGNLLSLSTNLCRVYGEGKMDFGANLGRIDAQPVGNMTYDLAEGKVNMDLMLLLDFFIAPNAMDKMSKTFEDYNGLDGVKFDRPVFERGLAEYIPKKEAEKLISKIQLESKFKRIPNELNKTLFLTDVKMKWNPETQSYQSYGKIGVGSIYKKEIHKMVDGWIEIVKKRSSTADQITIYLQLDRKTWYYFSYRTNLLQAISSDEEFNKIIKETKADKRKLKQEKGKPPYTYMASSAAKKKQFVRKMEGDD